MAVKEFVLKRIKEDSLDCSEIKVLEQNEVAARLAVDYYKIQLLPNNNEIEHAEQLARLETTRRQIIKLGGEIESATLFNRIENNSLTEDSYKNENLTTKSNNAASISEKLV